MGSSKTVDHALLDKYRQAIEAAQGLVPGAEPIGLAPAVDKDATESGIQSRAPKLAVALRAVLAPPPPPRWLTVHAVGSAAAAWFLENVKPEPQKGFGKVKEQHD